jgi:succinoglycan biosynthesis transport protein ExoP
MAGAQRENVVNDVTDEPSTNGDVGSGAHGSVSPHSSGAAPWAPAPVRPQGGTGSGGEIGAQLRMLRRRKWIVIHAAILVPLVAAAFSLQQQPRYQALASVLLTDSGLPGLAAANGVSSSPDRRAQTEADLARMQPVVKHTLDRIKARGLTIDRFLARSSVSPRTNADILDFRVSDPSPKRAQLLTTAYARQFIRDRRTVQAKAVADARRTLQEQARAGGVTAAALRERARALADSETAASLALLVRPATKAVQIGPSPLRLIALGLVLGLLLGVFGAYLWNALDTNVRDVREAGDLLGLPLLGGVRARSTSIAMLEQPHGPEAEAFRILRANLDFANIDRSARVILVTAALEGEDKSSTAANLAVAAALTGRRVVLVDLDLRHPLLDRLFGLEGQPGLTDVILGHAALRRALVSIPLSDGENASPLNGDGGTGTVEVLPSGPTPIDSGEFVGTKAVAQLIEQLRKRADLVLVSAPPLLPFVDARTLSTISDALVVVTNLDVVGRPALQELARVLASCPTRVLGFVRTGDSTDQHEPRYGSERRFVLRRHLHEGAA